MTFGDDKDRVLVKGDGEFTYLAPDIAYHRDKYQRGFALLIDIWGADHHGYIRRMKAAMQALGHDPTELEVLITQLVKLMRDGVEVKISKRTGDLVEMRDVIDEIGVDATRFTYLLQSIDTQQTFDLELAKSQSMDNPVFYVQMAHARACNIDAVRRRTRRDACRIRRRRPVVARPRPRARHLALVVRIRRDRRVGRQRPRAASHHGVAARAGGRVSTASTTTATSSATASPPN